MRQSYLLSAAATRPNMAILHTMLRDIDSEFQDRDSGGKAWGQANRAEGAWGQDTGYGAGRVAGWGLFQGGYGGRKDDGKRKKKVAEAVARNQI